MAARTYRLRIVREGVEFEAEGDKSFVLEMLKRFPQQGIEASLPADKQPRKDQSQKSALPLAKGKALSIREFVQQLGLKRHTDITLAFGYYLEKFVGMPEFSPADINNCYYEAKLESSNTSQMIIQNIRLGRIMASKKKGEKGKNKYTLTSTGETFIEAKLPRS